MDKSFVLAVSAAFALAACGQEQRPATPAPAPSPIVAPVAPAPTPAPATDAKATDAAPPATAMPARDRPRRWPRPPTSRKTPPRSSRRSLSKNKGRQAPAFVLACDSRLRRRPHPTPLARDCAHTPDLTRRQACSHPSLSSFPRRDLRQFHQRRAVIGAGFRGRRIEKPEHAAAGHDQYLGAWIAYTAMMRNAGTLAEIR